MLIALVKRILCFFALVVIGCNDQKQSDLLDISSRLNIISEIYESGNTNRAFELSSTLVNDYPQSPFSHQVYGAMLLEHSQSTAGKEKDEIISKGLFELNKSLSILYNSENLKKNKLNKMGVAYAIELNRFGRDKESITAFVKYYDSNFNEMMQDDYFRYSVINYSDSLSKNDMFDEAMYKYVDVLKLYPDDVLIIQGLIKLQSDNKFLDDAVLIADGFVRKNGFDSGIVFEKCRSYYVNNHLKDSFKCLNKMKSVIVSNDEYYTKVNMLLTNIRGQALPRPL